MLRSLRIMASQRICVREQTNMEHNRVKTSKTIEELKKVMDDAWWAYEADETLWDKARDAQDAYEVALTER